MTIRELMDRAASMTYDAATVMVQVGDRVYEATSTRFEVDIMKNGDYGRLVLVATAPISEDIKIQWTTSNRGD